MYQIHKVSHIFYPYYIKLSSHQDLEKYSLLNKLFVPSISVLNSSSLLKGFQHGDLLMSYRSMFQDVRDAVDYTHDTVSSQNPPKCNVKHKENVWTSQNYKMFKLFFRDL